MEKALPSFARRKDFGRSRRVLLGWTAKIVPFQGFREFISRKPFRAARRSAAVLSPHPPENNVFRR
jgi:hypothetical protein